MHDRLIEDQAEFDALCEHIREAGEVAFDTEFVSEFTYRPELGLLQFATRQQAVAVDPYQVRDLSAWWRIMSDDQTTIVVHGGREEVRYCLNLGGQRPGRLVDVQVAEGLRGRSFPLNYTALVLRVLGERTHGKETRTDWRRRPLTTQQIAYALEDVEHMLAIWDRQRQSLADRGRLPWAEAEFQRMVDEVVQERNREGWLRLPGVQSLSPREKTVAKELYAWRDAAGATRDKPPRKILRDDLVIELAKRQPQSEHDLLATRDMNRSDYRRMAGEMLACIAHAATLPEIRLPKIRRTDQDQDEQIVGQLLSLALSNLCAQEDVAHSLVGTVADLRHLVRWHVFGDQEGDPPRLLQGWRAELCGDLLSDVLDGKISIRVSDPQSDHPLKFERAGE
jgi:ribonuclease D